VTRRRRIALTGAALAFVVAIGSCAAAANARKPTRSAATFQLVSYSNNDGPRSEVIVTGAIGDYGEAVSVYPNGTVDRQHDSQLEFALTRGSFRVSIADLDKEIVNAFSASEPDPRTCSGRVRATGTTPILKGSRTGAYAHLSGRVTLTITFAEIVPRSTCNWTAAFVRQAMVVEGSGTITTARD
jgi:hypothetical protein